MESLFLLVFSANLFTGIAYLLIPWEMYQWFKGTKVLGFNKVSYLFISFIVLCGLHHLVMLQVIMHHAFFLQATVDTLMAIDSVLVWFVLRTHRTKIRNIVLAVHKVLDQEKN